jgi:hypothetical protein
VSDQNAKVCGESDLVASFHFVDVGLAGKLERTRVAAEVITIVVSFPGHVTLRVFADIFVVLADIAIIDKLRGKKVTEGTWDRGQAEGQRKTNLGTRGEVLGKLYQAERILSIASGDTNAE